MGSSRFPGKPLARILDRPMIEHVYRRVSLAEGVAEVIVATCDEEIRRAVEAFGGMAVMTSTSHQRASDRVAEAALRLDADIVVMVQGDEPMVTPAMVSTAFKPMLSSPDILCVNLAKCIETEEEYLDPNTIKVVMDAQWDALYFSREPIPTRRISGFEGIKAYKQVCIIPFRQEALKEYTRLAPTPLEIAESIDMMRFLENGRKVRMVETMESTHSVDTPEDLRHVESLMRQDRLTMQYMD